MRCKSAGRQGWLWIVFEHLMLETWIFHNWIFGQSFVPPGGTKSVVIIFWQCPFWVLYWTLYLHSRVWTHNSNLICVWIYKYKCIRELQSRRYIFFPNLPFSFTTYIGRHDRIMRFIHTNHMRFLIYICLFLTSSSATFVYLLFEIACKRISQAIASYSRSAL